MEEDLPIDIHYNKLLDWLISRRHCQSDWQKSVVLVRDKISSAIQDMPAVDEITELLQGTHIHYFHCRRIVELLKQTEGNTSKNIFGQYSSQKMKDWMEIMKLYEKESLYLAEAAQLLARNVNFEIPALKRQIAKCIQTQEDCTRREADYMHTSAEMREKFNSSCKQMRIEGKKIKKELSSLVRSMPETYKELANETPCLLPAVQYYTTFVAFLLAKLSGDESGSALPLIRHIAAKGNTTVYEWRTGVVPEHVEAATDWIIDNEEKDEDKEDEKEKKDDEIDWGDIDTVLDVNVDTDKAMTVDVDSIDFTSVDNVISEIKDEIDWSTVSDVTSAGIEIEVSGDKSCPIIDPSLDNRDVVRGEDALTILDNVSTRNLFLDELYELEAFLEQRLLELKGGAGSRSAAAGSDVIADVVLQAAPASVLIDAPVVEEMLSLVSALIERLTTRRMRELCLIRNSPRYVDRVVASLEKMLSDSDKMMSMSRLMSVRRDEALCEQRETEPRLETLRNKTKELQRLIEKEISVKYKNRRVNIMGEINTI